MATTTPEVVIQPGYEPGEIIDVHLDSLTQYALNVLEGELLEHTERCSWCDSHGLCAKGKRVVWSIEALTGIPVATSVVTDSPVVTSMVA